MWNEEAVNSNLEEILIKNKSLHIYLWSFEGETQARGPGAGWKVQIHFEDATQPGGVLHVNLSSGEPLTDDLTEKIKTWFLNASKKYPGKHEPRISINIDC